MHPSWNLKTKRLRITSKLQTLQCKVLKVLRLIFEQTFNADSSRISYTSFNSNAHLNYVVVHSIAYHLHQQNTSIDNGICLLIDHFRFTRCTFSMNVKLFISQIDKVFGFINKQHKQKPASKCINYLYSIYFYSCNSDSLKFC